MGDPEEQCTGSAWQNGNLGQSQAHYQEGDTVPYRAIIANAQLGEEYTVTIEWDTTKDGKHAIDYLKTFNATEETADPCTGVAGAICGGPTLEPIPNDPNVVSEGVTPSGGSFTTYNGHVTNVSGYTRTGSYEGSSSTKIVITIAPNADGSIVLAWGGHIATRADWGADSSAVAIPGSPYHMRLVGFSCSNPTNCSVGNQDRSLSSEAIIFPAHVTITKLAVPQSEQRFLHSPQLALD
ncbi:MAG: hypothetical protein UZ22_OP11002001081 [Microgenomates bacterium OLB23]|nr:MAG: hypothetical protein UZ22_OP11002001081 [Microgenomates bacterium OLB23]